MRPVVTSPEAPKAEAQRPRNYPKPPEDSYSLSDIYSLLTITPQTYLRWEAAGCVPRRDVPNVISGRMGRVSGLELRCWLAQREADRKATGKAWLKKPLKPLSWVPLLEAARIEERFEQLAIDIYRQVKDHGLQVSDETLSSMIISAIRKVQAKREASDA